MPWAGSAPAEASRRHFIVEPGVPFCAHSLTLRRALLPAAFDWAEFLIVRDGTGRVTHRDDCVVDLVRPGSVVTLMPDVPCGIEPEGVLRLTSVFLSEDFLQHQVRFRAAPWHLDDVAPHALVEWAYPEPSQVVRLPPWQMEGVFAAADGVASLTAGHRLRAEYHQASRLLHTVLEAVMPLVKTRLNSLPEHGDLSIRASLASMRVLRPLGEPVRLARQAIRDHYREPMLLDDLAETCHVSARQLSRQFAEAMGKTPQAYRDSLRVQHMIRLLVATTVSVAVITRDLGWSSQTQAARVFHDAVGMTPGEYRECFQHQPTGRARLTDHDMNVTDLDMFEQ